MSVHRRSGGSALEHGCYITWLFVLFLHKLLDPTSCLHYRIPLKRDIPQTAKLRKTVAYDICLNK